MRKVTFGGANTLDNYIARRDGAYDWIMWSDETNDIMKDYWSRIDTIVMGRKTWEIASAGAPRSKKKSSKNPYGKIKTFVFSRTIEAGVKDGAEFRNDDPAEFVSGLKTEDGKDICIMGGGDLARTLFDAGVIDEIGFCIHPILLGSGVPLFHEMSHQIDLELLECRPFKNGCIYALYRIKNQ